MGQYAGSRRQTLAWLLACGLVRAAWAREPLPAPQGDVLLEVHGAITRAQADGVARLDRALLGTLPTARIRTHTSVTDGAHRFEGFLVRDLLRFLGAHGSTVRASALNDYVIDFEAREFERWDVLAAWSMDGEVLRPSDKGPLWLVYPRDDHRVLQDIRYDYRWVWQLVRLDVLP